jgi:flagellar basal body-associated protein FliL
MDKKQLIMIIVAVVILIAAIALIAMYVLGGSGSSNSRGPATVGFAEPTAILPDVLVSI